MYWLTVIHDQYYDGKIIVMALCLSYSYKYIQKLFFKRKKYRQINFYYVIK